MRTRRWSFGSVQTWLLLAAVATLVYGVEAWRSRAASRATRGEQARFHAAVTCLLGADGARLAYSPGEARARLRALAMDTPLQPAPTWIDRCIPLLRDLAVHGNAVDVTRDPRATPTLVERHARELALSAARVGLVWEIRAGDPDNDMDRLAELLVRTATEIDLASASISHDTLKGPRAPVPRPFPAMARSTRGGLTPLPAGTPTSFLAGAPLPFVARVALRDGALRPEVLSNDDARWWRVVPQGVVRVVSEEGAVDGLSPVFLDALDGSPGHARIASPPPGVDPRVVSLDAVTRGHVLWLAEAVRGRSPVLARLPFGEGHGESATAARLTHGAREDADRVDEEVAVGALGDGVVAAYTDHVPNAGLTTVRLVRAAGSERAAVREVPFATSAWQLRGRRPGLAICAASRRSWVFAASLEEWRAGVLEGGALVDAGRIIRSGGRRFDESLTVRCSEHGALVYGRERPRVSPMWRCESTPAPSCEALPVLPSTQPGDLRPWTTANAHGEQRAHAEWPLALALTGYGTTLAARASGTIVAVARLPRGANAWEQERVVFDAAIDEPGATVLGVELYSDGARTLLVVSTASELRAALSDDDGATWRAP